MVLLIFVNVLLLPFTNVKSQNNQFPKKSLGKSNERILVSEFAMFAQKMVEGRLTEQIRFLGTHY